MKSVFLFCLFGLVPGFTWAQSSNRENYDLRIPGKAPAKSCIDFASVLQEMPFDVRFSTFFKGDSVILTHSDADWFWKIIAGKNDGIAIDLVFREQYLCDNIHRVASSWSHKGFLLPPVYRDEIKQRLLPVQEGYIAVFAGRVPKSWKKENLEANYLILQDKNLCHYSNIINLDYQGWDIMDNGLYYDTLERNKLEEKFRDVAKTLHFTIPFEKDKWEYKAEDIQPLYDSLKLTDYAIKSIRIHSYTSVEGTAARNEKLQKLRAESLVKALQSFQPEKLESTVTTSENWVEFLNDVASSGYDDLLTLTKEEIKESLTSTNLAEKLEPVLKHHRKGIIDLDLEKRISYFKSSGDELKKLFNQQIAQRNIEEALELQQIIFYKLERQELAENFLEELDIPQQLPFGRLLINDGSFRYEHGLLDVFEAISTFEKLNALLKDNPKITYNLVALKLRSWLQSGVLIEKKELKENIETLPTLGIPDLLARRLLVNYHIILSEIFLQQKKYSDKDRSLKYIYDTYAHLDLNDVDLLNLARYFSYSSKFDWAEQILFPRTKSLEVDEDLLFYYLNLTIYEERNTKNNSYRTIMLNAINGNRKRFCTLFNPIRQGGITFQLLGDPYLKKTFCENCQ